MSEITKSGLSRRAFLGLGATAAVAAGAAGLAGCSPAAGSSDSSESAATGQAQYAWEYKKLLV